MTRSRIIFAGTPDFALASLTALVESGYAPIAVLTQPDRPAGRGKQLTASPVKICAGNSGIEVLQPRTLRDENVASKLAALQPDIIIVAAYGLLLPQNILDIPRRGCVNVHASLLPRWRGAAPVQAAILSGDTTSGISLMQMTAGLDCGPVICQAMTNIGSDETAGELHDRLATLGGELLAAKLPKILAGEAAAVAQDEASATFARKFKTSDAELDWRMPAEELRSRVRAYNPTPGAYFHAGNARIKCWNASIEPGISAAPGTVMTSGNDGVVIACNGGGLRLESLQMPGKRRVTAREFAANIDLDGKRLPC